MRRAILLLIAVSLIGGYFAWSRTRAKSPAGRLKTAKVEHGDLIASITATGTIEPEQVIDVGAQVAGLIEGFGEDPNQPGKLID